MSKRKEVITLEQYNDHFRPKQVDEQIEWLAQCTLDGEQEDSLSVRFIQRLQRYYEMERQKEVLEQAWKRIEQKGESSMLLSSEDKYAQNEKQEQERSGPYRMQQRMTVSAPVPRWGIVAAVVVVALLVGSMAVIMSLAAGNRGAPELGSPSQQAKPTPNLSCIAKPTSELGGTPRVRPVDCVTPTPAPNSVLPKPAPASNPKPAPASNPKSALGPNPKSALGPNPKPAPGPNPKPAPAPHSISTPMPAPQK